MNNDEKDREDILDRTISEIRNESIDPATVSAAADRVWASVSSAAADQAPDAVETIRTCADYRALIPAWREHRLPNARALLVEDHLHECPACRKAFHGRAAAEVIPMRRAVRPVWKWAVAATLIVGVGFGGYFAWDRFGPVPDGPRATVYAADGVLYKTVSGVFTPLAPGAPIQERETIRTDKGAGAVVRLRDGSMVEMRERTELALNTRRDGTTIELSGGSVIVQAAKQRHGHLYVATADCTVSVVGTVFSVNSGMKGSLVSVVEGEVQVDQAGHTSVLRPGDQLSTSPALTPVSVKDEISWSRNFDKHLAVLNEFAKLQKKLETMPGPGLRYASKLLPMVPDGAIFYASIPNLGPTLDEASQLFQQQLAQSDVLRQWWDEKMSPPGAQAKLDDALNRFKSLSGYLGDEVVITLVAGPDGKPKDPLAMAEVVKPGLRAFLEQEIAKLKGAPGDHDHIRIVDDLAGATSTGKECLIYVGSNFVAVSSDLNQLRQVAALAANPGAGTFAKTDFYSRIAAAYTQGVTWLVCADLQPVIGREAASNQKLQRSGFGDMRFVTFERKSIAGRTENHLGVTFSKPRSSVASWLAAPAPMRGLDYVSPDASIAFAVLAKNPAKMLEDISSITGTDALAALAGFEAATGINVRTGLIEPLGGEIVVALDGPVLPQPAWKVVLEVTDPARFMGSLEKLVAASGGLAKLGQETVSGRTLYTLSGPKSPQEAHFVFDNGVAIVTPTRDLLTRALQLRSTGYTLTHSNKFTALLPHDAQANFSGMLYQTLGSLVAGAAGSLPISSDQAKSLSNLAANTEPTLIVAYGGPDSIRLATAGSLFSLRAAQMLGFAGHRRHH